MLLLLQGPMPSSPSFAFVVRENVLESAQQQLCAPSTKPAAAAFALLAAVPQTALTHTTGSYQYPFIIHEWYLCPLF